MRSRDFRSSVIDPGEGVVVVDGPGHTRDRPGSTVRVSSSRRNESKIRHESTADIFRRLHSLLVRGDACFALQDIEKSILLVRLSFGVNQLVA